MDGASTARIRAAWRQVAGAPDAFRQPGLVIVPVADRPGRRRRVSVITLTDATCVCAPPELASSLDTRGARRLADPSEARAILGHDVEVVGPAVLAFADRSTARPPDHQAGPVEPAEPGSAELEQLAAACDPADIAESSLANWTHWIHLIRDRDLVVAAAGIEVWAETLAHVGVLTRADRRGRGLAKTTAARTVQAALAAGLVAQWRARATLTASRRVAAALGFVELGTQVTYKLAGTFSPASSR